MSLFRYKITVVVAPTQIFARAPSLTHAHAFVSRQDQIVMLDARLLANPAHCHILVVLPKDQNLDGMSPIRSALNNSLSVMRITNASLYRNQQAHRVRILDIQQTRAIDASVMEPANEQKHLNHLLQDFRVEYSEC
jgi:hypothetical protein